MSDNHKFWHAEPLGKDGGLGEDTKDNKETELPDKFSWHTFKITDIDIIHKFLLNYFNKINKLKHSTKIFLKSRYTFRLILNRIIPLPDENFNDCSCR